jgi:hypothetical protein
MLNKVLFAACFLAVACVAEPAFAQAPPTMKLCVPTSGNLCPLVGPSNPLPISGSFSATLSPFTPSASGARGTPVTVTTVDSSGPLPTGTSVVVTNSGANPMYCNVNGIAATTSDQLITAGGGWFNFGVPSGSTTLHCIATGGSTIANTVGGSGLGAGTGGGSSGGGGGGNVNVTQWNSVAVGSPTAHGTAPAGNAPGVNAFITNQPTIANTSFAAIGPTAVGSAAVNPPVLQGGTANGAATGNVQVQKVDANGTQFFDCNSSSNTLCGLINSPPPLSVNGSNVAWTGISQGTNQTGTITAANVVDTPANASPTNAWATTSATPGTATQLLAASTSHHKVNIKVEGAAVVCFSKYTTTPVTTGASGVFCLPGATTANGGNGGSYTTPVGETDPNAIYMVSATASVAVYAEWQ